MLKSLEIRNFILIDKLKIIFDNGFNVLTGETGAGKSIIISALELITGEKGSVRVVGVNAEKLLVIGTFELTSGNSVVKEKLLEWGININGNELIIKREINKDGKSKSFINSNGVRVAELKELGDLLVDIHGQHEHQSLFNQQNHILFYDNYLQVDKLLLKYQTSYKKLISLENKHNEIINNKNTILKEKSFLTYALEEIENAKLKINEDEDLKNDISVMGNSENIDNILSTVVKDIFGSENGAYIKLMRDLSLLQSLSVYDNKIEDIISQVEGITLNLEDIKSVLSEIKQKTKFNPQKLEESNERLFFISTLKKKYGSNIKEILEYANEASEKLSTLDFSESDIKNLKIEIEENRKEASDLAKELSSIRKEKRLEFVKRIESEMSDLGMASTRFDIEIGNEEADNGVLEIDGLRYKSTNKGIDHIEFIIAPNKQAIFLPLRKIASGGEVSRIMLSLKTVLSTGDFTETMVFDEIDVGVGGGIAEVIGEKITALSKNKQIIAVTHLAQIAIYAKSHFKVTKDEGSDVVTSKINEIKNDERIYEVARMMAGKEITEVSIKHASQMLQNAN